MGGISNLAPDIDTAINGWSKRAVGAVSVDAQFSIELGEGTAVRVQQGNVYKSVYDSAIVYLERSGHSPEELWHVNGQPRKVSKREYAQGIVRH